ncbi:MAG: hypothetical protein MZU95_15785 [Desulfomicrobium escambiense]|nr:hypothetical protein [Desulfomicrobium escambiense]
MSAGSQGGVLRVPAATLARDLGTWSDEAIGSNPSVHMTFPQTGHVETHVRLRGD